MDKSTMSDNKKLIGWAIVVIAIVAATLLGIRYPIPEPPEDVVALGAHITNPVDVLGSSSAAAPAITFEGDTDSGFFRSAADTLNASVGGVEQMELDASGFTLVPPLDVDNTSNFSDTITIASSLVLPQADATEAITLTTASCGKTYFLNAATEFETILPAVSGAGGCSFRFVVKAAPSGASYTIITGNSKENVLIGGINELEVDTGDDGPYDADADTITFVDGTAVVGDFVYMISDGTSWYLEGQANADGGITLTQAD